MFNGLFKETSITGMLEEKDLSTIDSASPFIKVVVDRCRGKKWMDLSLTCSPDTLR